MVYKFCLFLLVTVEENPGNEMAVFTGVVMNVFKNFYCLVKFHDVYR